MNPPRGDPEQRYNCRCRIRKVEPVTAKQEKRRPSVHFEHRVTKQIKSGKKAKPARNPIQKPKMRHEKPSEAQIARLSSALGKGGRDGASGSYGF